MGTLLPAATMFAAASCRKAVLSAAACSKLSGGQRRVFARPAIDALAMMAMPQPGKTWAEWARCMRLEPRRLVRTSLRGSNRMQRAHSAQVFPGCGMAIMAKASIAGRAKTRLCPPLSFEQAAALNTAFLQDAAANIVAAGRRVPIRGYAAYGPPGAQSAAFFKSIMPASFGLIEAWHACFGDSLHGTIQEMLARGHESAVVVNADSPTLP